ncbi:MAG: endonuclease/exonuclease/phosphatase family protein [Oscillospiraceae bacterium]|nr:endonuclease/exonuclease/phosphatase family protein [Oscillospiraceae bacterium]
MANKKTIKIILKSLLCFVLALVLIVVGYLSYVLLSYSRIEDNMQITPLKTGADEAVKVGESYSAVIQNLGFGAYTQDFTFFMDGGTQSWAESRESVLDCIDAAVQKAEEFEADFILFQEVDTDSTRSYHINQREILEKRFKNYSSAFAVNYHSALLMYPFTQPHGASNSGILTLSRYNIDSSLRRSLPISESFSKFLDLDRCYSVSRIPVENGKEFVIFNVHLSAYGGSDEIRTAQMTMLFNDMKKEYQKGNYCVCGGDFNHDFTGDSTQKLNGGAEVDFGWAQPFPEKLLPDCITRCTSYEGATLVPTCRNCDVPYKEGNFTIIVDGFLVTENVEALSVKNIKTDFTYSDHNPVYLEFKLK